MKSWEEESSKNGEGGGFVGQVLNAGKGVNKSQVEKPSFQAFTGTGVSLGGGNFGGDVQMSDEDVALIAAYGEDPELLLAMKLSMQQMQQEEL